MGTSCSTARRYLPCLYPMCRADILCPSSIQMPTPAWLRVIWFPWTLRRSGSCKNQNCPRNRKARKARKVLPPKHPYRHPKHQTVSRRSTSLHMRLRLSSFLRMPRSRSKRAPLSTSAIPLLDLGTARSRHRTTPMGRSSVLPGSGMRNGGQGPGARAS